jgi:hypothetical protein
MAVKERLRYFISEHLGESVKSFEEECGLSNGLINNIKGSISAKTLDRICEHYPDLNRIWVLTGEGPMLKSNMEIIHTKEEEKKTEEELRKLQMKIESLEKSIKDKDELIVFFKDLVQRETEKIGRLINEVHEWQEQQKSLVMIVSELKKKETNREE